MPPVPDHLALRPAVGVKQAVHLGNHVTGDPLRATQPGLAEAEKVIVM